MALALIVTGLYEENKKTLKMRNQSKIKQSIRKEGKTIHPQIVPTERSHSK
jgi:hypothetical protein